MVYFFGFLSIFIVFCPYLLAFSCANSYIWDSKTNIMEISKLINDRLTVSEKDGLPEALKLQPKQFSRRLSGASSWELEELVILSGIIKISVQELIFEYGLGKDKVTIDQMDKYLHQFGSSVGEVAHAA
jgi:hypothetical protein